jgi:NADH-quinone oxidoreductase subunit C
VKARPETVQSLEAQFPGVAHSEFREEIRVVVPREAAFSALKWLKETKGFDFLSDVTCVDYLNYRDAADRFGLVYLLVNTKNNERLTVRVFLNEPDLTIPSVVPLWNGADWLEREVYDMFGIEFEGHPDLRRILMPPAYTTYPLRKDYPLRGRGPTLRRGSS